MPETEKAQTPDCKCPVPDHDMRGTCKRCDGFACEYADRGQTRCPAWRCDCFIETHPFDNPRGLHPEAFVVAPLNPPAGSDFATFGEDAAEWAEATMEAGVETWGEPVNPLGGGSDD